MPIFMIGTQRSGSNLLRLMLNQLPEVAAPHPPHILQRMMPLMPSYGDLNRSDAFAQLVDDVCKLVELNPVPWEGVEFDRKDVAARCRARSLVAVYGAIYDVYAEANKAKTWCCKSLGNIAYVPEIEAYYPGAKYIYLYRDGRDVAVSFHKAVVGEKHYYHIAKEWTETQELALNVRATIGNERVFSLSYEALTEDAENTARAMCEFLGYAYTPSMLDFHKTDEAKRAAASSSLWGNVTNPLIKKNTKKFLKDATEDEMRIFESVSGHVLDALGYERVYVKKGQEIQFSAEDIKAFDSENKRLKEEMRKNVDAADLERRKRQENLLKEIKTRAA